MIEKTVVMAKIKNQWIKLHIEGITSAMKRIYAASGKKDLGLALMKVKDFFKNDAKLMEDAGFLAKLIQLEASGYIEPPINLGRLYSEVVKKMNLKEKMEPL